MENRVEHHHFATATEALKQDHRVIEKVLGVVGVHASGQCHKNRCHDIYWLFGLPL